VHKYRGVKFYLRIRIILIKIFLIPVLTAALLSCTTAPSPNRGITKYTKIINLDPHNAVAFTERGKAHFYSGEYALAIEDFTQSINIEPLSSCAYHCRGLTYFQIRDFDSAIADFRVYLRITPSDDYVWERFEEARGDRQPIEGVTICAMN